MFHYIEDYVNEYTNENTEVHSIWRIGSGMYGEIDVLHEYKKDKDCHFIFCSDPNDIHTITSKEVRKLCKKNNIEWKNQTYIQFVTEMKKIFFTELNGRITFTKEKHESIVKKFKFQCNKCKCK